MKMVVDKAIHLNRSKYIIINCIDKRQTFSNIPFLVYTCQDQVFQNCLLREVFQKLRNTLDLISSKCPVWEGYSHPVLGRATCQQASVFLLLKTLDLLRFAPCTSVKKVQGKHQISVCVNELGFKILFGVVIYFA